MSRSLAGGKMLFFHVSLRLSHVNLGVPTPDVSLVLLGAQKNRETTKRSALKDTDDASIILDNVNIAPK